MSKLACWRPLLVRGISLFALLILFSERLPAQTRSGKWLEEENFRFSVIEYPTASSDSLRADLYVAVPYSTLSFLNASDKYVADYAVIVQARDIATQEVIIDLYKPHTALEVIGERSVRQTARALKFDATQESIVLPQGRNIEFRIAVRDLSSKHSTDTTILLVTRRFEPAMSISDPMIYRRKAGLTVLPLIGSNLVGLDETGSGIFAQIRAAAADSVDVYSVLTQKGSNDLIASSKQKVFVDSGLTPVFMPLPADSLLTGELTLTLFLLPRSDGIESDLARLKKQVLSTSTPLNLESNSVTHVPNTLAALDEAIEQLQYIASASAWDSLRAADGFAARGAAFIEFWRKQDPYPRDGRNEPMEVFYARLDYVQQMYGSSEGGWRSDRGRVYLQLGAPSRMDREPYGVNQRPYEVWDYYDLNARYGFVDAYLVGDYRLATAPPPLGYFLWQRGSEGL